MDIIEKIANAIKSNTPFNKSDYLKLSNTEKVNVVTLAFPQEQFLKKLQNIAKRKIKYIKSQNNSPTFFGQFINEWVRVRLYNKPDDERLTLKLLPTIIKDFSTEKFKINVTLETAICPKRTCPQIYKKIIEFSIGKTTELHLSPEETEIRQHDKKCIWIEKLICFNVDGVKTYINHDHYKISFINNFIKILDIYCNG